MFFFAAFASLGAQARPHPDSVQFITSDIAHFWNAIDKSNQFDLDSRLRENYLDVASSGLRAFAPGNIGGALDLARTVFARRADYDRLRPATEQIGRSVPSMRAAVRQLAIIYPAARFTDVSFVIGRFVVGGWTRGDTMVIAAEMYPDSAMLPRIVAHELVHHQQPPTSDGQTLLERAFNEGSADFIGELISGGTINPEAQRYGRAHEAQLWREFKQVMGGTDYLPWLYAGPVGGRPADLGYFIGYRIAEAYYGRATDKRAAVRELIGAKDIVALLSRSGYSP